MKKFRIISLLLVFVLLLSACGKKTGDEPSVSDPGNTAQQPSGQQDNTGKDINIVRPSGQTVTGKTDNNNTSTQTPDPTGADDKEYDIWTWYNKLEGTWLVSEGEIEGYRYDAEEAGVYALVEFYTGHTAHYIERSTETDSVDEYFYGLEVEEGQLYGSGDPFHVVMDNSSTPVVKTVSIEDGKLVMDMEYKGGFGGGTLFFTKVESRLLARVTEMEAQSYNTNPDGSFTFDPGWYNVVDSHTLLPQNPGDQLYWHLITAEEDGVEVWLEAFYAGTDYFSMILRQQDMFVPSKTEYHIVLNRGETLAVRVSKPELPEYRVCVSKGELWGSYEFEKLNKFTEPTFSDSNDPGNLVYYAGQMGMVFPITGHSKELERNTSRTGNNANTTRFLEGKWVLYDDNNYIRAVLFADHNGQMQLITSDSTYSFSYYIDRLFATEADPADLICLYAESLPNAQASHFQLPGGIGDYYFEVYNTDNEEILFLTQANNGDAVLPLLLGDDFEPTYAFHRFEGTSADIKKPASQKITARVVKYDLDNWKLWLQPCMVIDKWEDGSDLWARNSEPCYACEPADADVLNTIFYNSSNYTYPMLLTDVEINAAGQITKMTN